MHEAKTRLSKLVRSVEEDGEVVILQRNGRPVAEIHRCRPAAAEPIRRLRPKPELQVTFAPGYDPAEPATADEWPEDCR
ncbi:MAG: type II toxin-antitoxin system Phd/YefM family antitoxin [Opitutales bacterium]|nr:type II toxin-antitoxin system Phd/YefM family antitoxin [Opitutales bacterium]